MKSIRSVLALVALLAVSGVASANKYVDTIALFKKSGESADFFNTAYGYAVFPTIGKGGFVVGGAHGSGHVYEKGKYIGNTSMTQLSVGFQAGGQAYSQIVFFQDAQSLKTFTSGNFEFGAEASAVAITAGASAKANTSGSSAGASVTKNEAKNVGGYNKGMATFTVAKGGLMYEASIGGQKFNYKGR